jgi:hypothetical protein
MDRSYLQALGQGLRCQVLGRILPPFFAGTSTVSWIPFWDATPELWSDGALFASPRPKESHQPDMRRLTGGRTVICVGPFRYSERLNY